VLPKEAFIERLSSAGIPCDVADFVRSEVQPYLFKPLLPDPEDRLISEFKVDGDDLSDIVQRFEVRFGCKWIGYWTGPEDPTLREFAQSLLQSTEPR
jgi:hypothetical protein